MAPWESVEILGIEIQAVPSYEKDSVAHSEQSGYTGFIITLNENTVYFSGDAGEMEEFINFHDVTIAILCVRLISPTLMFDQEM